VLKHYTVLLSHQVSSAPALRSFALDDKHTAAATAATTATLPAGAVSMSYSDALQLLALVTADGHFRSAHNTIINDYKFACTYVKLQSVLLSLVLVTRRRLMQFASSLRLDVVLSASVCSNACCCFSPYCYSHCHYYCSNSHAYAYTTH
jgi:hypothetical protein